MANPYVGEIRSVAFNFAPVGWALCDGSLQSISQNTTLFSLLGTTYGGDGVTTFALPNLGSRVAIHMGANVNGIYTIGQTGGTETVTLTTAQIPTHNHSIVVVPTDGNSSSPANTILAASTEDQYTSLNATGTMAAGMVQSTGSSQSHTNIQPYTAMYYIIALFGVYPSQG